MENGKTRLEKTQNIGELLAGSGALIMSAVGVARAVINMRNRDVDPSRRLPRVSAFARDAATLMLAVGASTDAMTRLAPRIVPGDTLEAAIVLEQVQQDATPTMELTSQE